MRDLPVQMPPMRELRRGVPVRDVFFFCVAFAAMFGSAMLGLDLLL
ncbi:hypothetical protein [Brevundimonas sp.]